MLHYNRDSAVYAVAVWIFHKPVLYQNIWTDQAGFGIDASLGLSYIVLEVN